MGYLKTWLVAQCCAISMTVEDQPGPANQHVRYYRAIAYIVQFSMRQRHLMYNKRESAVADDQNGPCYNGIVYLQKKYFLFDLDD